MSALSGCIDRECGLYYKHLMCQCRVIWEGIPLPRGEGVCGMVDHERKPGKVEIRLEALGTLEVAL